MNFSKEFFDFQYASLMQGKEQVAENVKIVLYKTIPDYFDLLDFDNNDIFLDPALFAVIVKLDTGEMQDADILRQMVYGSIAPAERPKQVKVFSDKYGIIYLPNIGWITKVEKSTSFLLENIGNGYLLNGDSVHIEPLVKNNKVGIELVKYRLELFDDRFYDGGHTFIDYDVEGAYKAKAAMFNNSLNYIAENAPWLAHLLQQGCAKSIIFDDGTHPLDDLYCKRNSFASFQVKRISFHNIYQPWYDEVFFLDDISHQMGHVLFDLITFDKKRFFKVNHDEAIKANSEYGRIIDSVETRTFEIVFHSLYTFFLILNVMDTCMQSDRFNAEQKAEIKGRIAFYLRKSLLDFELFEEFDKNEYAQSIYTPEGMYIYMGMKQSFVSIHAKYHELLESYRMNNQTYNYNHKKFLEFNKFEEVG